MDIDSLCMRCMKGTVKAGTCQVCGARFPEPRAAHALPLKTILHGRYLVGSILGAGGFGITYAAYDILGQSRAAIKEYMPLSLASRQADGLSLKSESDSRWYEWGMERFEQEARIIYRYRGNPNIVQVSQIFRENHTSYYVMEYLQGEDLHHYVLARGGKVSWENLECFVVPILDILEKVHKDGIIHRDISPENIYITGRDTAKLIDFGAAKGYLSHASKSIILKMGYTPPEQYLYHGNQGPWSDIYALSATIYNCLTGVCPPDASERVVDDKLVPLGEFPIQLPSNVEKALMKSLKLQTDQRYQDVASFRGDLLGMGKRTGPRLKGISGRYQGKEFFLEEKTVVGRDAECQIAFPQEEAGVSRLHCQFILEGDSVFVMDLNSTYGTSVNGSRIMPGYWYPIKNGDLILVGRNQLCLVV